MKGPSGRARLARTALIILFLAGVLALVMLWVSNQPEADRCGLPGEPICIY
jgi:hypothetical protein